jgi:type IX secretion system PorP/SprF family membrane protein
MKIKGIILALIIWSSFPNLSNAQQLNNTNLYLQNIVLVNQAFAGYKPGNELGLSYRYQWTGIKNAPQTGILSFHNSINRTKRENTYNYVNNNRKRLNKYRASNKSFWAYSGVLMYDKAGLFSHYQLALSGAYHLKLSKKAMLSFAPTVNMSLLGLDPNGVNMIQPNDPTYNNFTTLGKPESYMTFDFAVAFYLKDFAIGFSAEQIMTARFKHFDEDKIPTQYFVGTIKYDWRVSNDWKISPTINTKFGLYEPNLTDIYVSADFRSLFWFGLGYKTSNSIVGLMGFNVANRFKFGYSYNTGVNRSQTTTQGAHELYLSYSFKRKK